jgi:ATP-dependent DNA helicase DinG
VLCATSSFWQGVDVPGDALRAVLIDKLPFQVPTEPVVAARLSRLEEQGENSFLRYSVPAAIIALRQGLGRLIRSREDRGVLGVFDSRLRTRRYGFLFTRSLPSFPIVDNIEAIRTSANEWWSSGQDREDPASDGPRLRKADS